MSGSGGGKPGSYTIPSNLGRPVPLSPSSGAIIDVNTNMIANTIGVTSATRGMFTFGVSEDSLKEAIDKLRSELMSEIVEGILLEDVGDCGIDSYKLDYEKYSELDSKL